MNYDFDKEASEVCSAIGSNNGRGTVNAALREAYAAGASSRDGEVAALKHDLGCARADVTYWQNARQVVRDALTEAETARERALADLAALRGEMERAVELLRLAHGSLVEPRQRFLNPEAINAFLSARPATATGEGGRPGFGPEREGFTQESPGLYVARESYSAFAPPTAAPGELVKPAPREVPGPWPPMGTYKHKDGGEYVFDGHGDHDRMSATFFWRSSPANCWPTASFEDGTLAFVRSASEPPAAPLVPEPETLPIPRPPQFTLTMEQWEQFKANGAAPSPSLDTEGRRLVDRWRRDYGTMDGLENGIDAAIAEAVRKAKREAFEEAARLLDALELHWNEPSKAGEHARRGVRSSAKRLRALSSRTAEGETPKGTP